MDVDSAIVQAARKLGYGDVKSEQSRVIREIVAGNDVFVALPTGYGKSLCYALAHTRAVARLPSILRGSSLLNTILSTPCNLGDCSYR